jgi:hypothetical protein
MRVHAGLRAVAAVAARDQITGTVRSLYTQRLYGARIGYATSLTGSYQVCPGHRPVGAGGRQSASRAARVFR